METNLIIFLHAHQEWNNYSSIKLDALIMNQSGDAIHDLPNIFLSDISAQEHKKIIVIIPSEHVLLTQVNLVKMSKQRLSQAIPFALEEQLIDDVSLLHFAHGEKNHHDESLPVAVVAHEKMQLWLAFFKSAHIIPHVFIPAPLVIPNQTDTPIIHEEKKINKWSLAVITNKNHSNHHTILVRTHKNKGFSATIEHVNDLLFIAMQSQETHITINNYTDAAIAPLLKIENSTIKIEEKLLPEKNALRDFASIILEKESLNLLQGVYVAKRSKKFNTSTPIKWIYTLTSAWIFLIVCYPIITFFMLSHRSNLLEIQINDIYKKHFPHATAMIAPKLRMEELLQKITTQNNSNKLFESLAVVGEELTHNHITLQRFDYQEQQLHLNLISPTANHFTDFLNFLNRKNIKIKQQNANVIGQQVNAEIVI